MPIPCSPPHNGSTTARLHTSLPVLVARICVRSPSSDSLMVSSPRSENGMVRHEAAEAIGAIAEKLEDPSGCEEVLKRHADLESDILEVWQGRSARASAAAKGGQGAAGLECLGGCLPLRSRLWTMGGCSSAACACT